MHVQLSDNASILFNSPVNMFYVGDYTFTVYSF